jgi:hypothetical protein
MKETCTQTPEHLAEFVYGGLNPPARAAVEEHLAGCRLCTTRVEALEGERASLRRFVADLDAGMEGRLDQIRRRLQAESPPELSQERSLWRNFLRSRAARLTAAAAVLLAGLTLLMHLGRGSMGLSNTALARVTEAMNNVPWVHLQATVTRDGKATQYESWLSNPLQISASKGADGRIVWAELADRRRAVYDPGRRTIVISYASRTSTGDIINPSSPIDAFRKQHEAGDTAVTCERGRHEGVDADIYEASHYAGRDAQRYLRSRHRLVTDRQRHLILVSEQYYYGPDGTLLNSDKAIWDYPSTGPQNICDIGAPKSARVLDFAPAPEVLKLLDTYEAKRDNFPGRYVAVVQYSRYDTATKSYRVDGMNLFSSNGIVKRSDGLSFQPVDQGQFAAQCGDSFEPLMNWWQHRESGSVAVERESIALCDEEYAYSTSTTADGSWRPLQKWYSPSRKDRQLLQFGRQSFTYGDALAELGYPLRLLGRFYREPTQISIVQDDYARENACICVELLYEGEVNRGLSGNGVSVVLPQRRLFYLDPNRDYFCRREEVRHDVGASWPVDPNWLAGVSPDDRQNSRVFFDTTGQPDDVVHGVKRAVVVREMLAYDRTDGGKWYPKKITTHGQAERYDGTVAERQSMITIFLNTNPTFGDGTFDPGQLPK